MNYNLPFIPERTTRPRDAGITMMMDKGLGLLETESFISAAAEYTDLVKFGFGTALVTNNLEEKLKLYKEAGIEPYFGGTLFEIFAVRNMVDEYKKMVDKYKVETIEVSDGSMKIHTDEKLQYIETLSKDFCVLSEVGSKVKGVELTDNEWVESMAAELGAGSWKVIAEARESGTIGIYNADGSANKSLIEAIMKEIPMDNVLWEAPIKNQQVMFIQMIGHNVNLGNISPNEVVALEVLRCGMRGDTLFDYLPEELQSRKLL